jgi:hypothetical protein
MLEELEELQVIAAWLNKGGGARRCRWPKLLVDISHMILRSSPAWMIKFCVDGHDSLPNGMSSIIENL